MLISTPHTLRYVPISTLHTSKYFYWYLHYTPCNIYWYLHYTPCKYCNFNWCLHYTPCSPNNIYLYLHYTPWNIYWFYSKHLVTIVISTDVYTTHHIISTDIYTPCIPGLSLCCCVGWSVLYTVQSKSSSCSVPWVGWWNERQQIKNQSPECP